MEDSVEVVAEGLNFPTSLAFGPEGEVLVAESGLPFGGAPPGGRIIGIEDGRVVIGDLAPPVNGLLSVGEDLVISVGGQPPQLLRVAPDGGHESIVEGFAGPGNYHLNMAAHGPDGFLYFGVGAMTNSGVVGPDGLSIGWLRQLRHAHDVPGFPVTLTGLNFEATDPVDGNTTRTGAFAPFGVASADGQRIEPGPMPTASIMRCRPDGSDLEMVAWGLRNAYGIGFTFDGRLLAVDQGADDRGSRPVGEVPDFLFEIKPGRWYGWPDFMGGVPVTDSGFVPKRGTRPEFVLANHADLPPPEHALVRFPAHTAATRFCQLPPTLSEIGGHLLVTLFGDERPMTAPDGPRLGRSIVRVDPSDWRIEPFCSKELERPIDVVVGPAAEWVYVVDFGKFEMGPQGAIDAVPATGRVIRFRLAG